MTRPNIHIVLTDDWELRGNGSGNMEKIQFDTINKLCDIYDNFGIKGTFNAEIMQQIYHLKYGEKHHKLLKLAADWEKYLLDIYSKGHDVQLHIHPQWHEAKYENGKWRFTNSWSICDLDKDVLDQLVFDCKSYLDNLIRKIDTSYSCISFRAGSWHIAPHDHIFRVLAENGIKIDYSIAPKLFKTIESNNSISIADYRNCEELFLPYYPDLNDARKVSAFKQPIIECPTHTFKTSILERIINSRMKNKPNSVLPNRENIYTSKPNQKNGIANKLKRIHKALTNNYIVSDLSNMSYKMLKRAISDIRKRAKKSGWETVPIIFENHTKDIGNFEPIYRFCDHLTQQNDIKVITISQLYENFNQLIYKPIKKCPNKNK